MADKSNSSRSSSRVVHVTGTGASEPMFMTNRICTGRYTPMTFLPLNLFEQFQRVPNIWFLIIAIFQLAVTSLTPTTGWSTMAPLLFLLLISAGKDAYIDYKRHKQDHEINRKTFHVWDGEKFASMWCQDLKVGHLVLLRSGEFAPADILLLASGHTKDICYVDISGILGEANLKIKSISKAMKSLRHWDLEIIMVRLPRLLGEVRVQDPDISLESFEGRMKLKGFPSAERLSLENLILRGSVITSTPWVICLVLYTGIETKIMLNAQKIPIKNTRVERLANKVILMLLVVCLFMAFISTFLNTFASVDDPESNFFEIFLIFILLYNNITPISLFVTMDLLRLYQYWNLRRKKGYLGERVELLNSGVCEDLGRVEYIVSDKTGTLTENERSAKEFVLGEEQFGPCTEMHRGCRHMGLDTESGRNQTNISCYDPSPSDSLKCGYSRLRNMLFSPDCPKDADLFFEAMTLCNSIMITEGGYEMVFICDDKALKLCAEDFGYHIIEKTADFCKVDVRGTERKYRIYGLNEITKKNPRTRILVQREGCKSGFLLIKGGAAVMATGRKSVLNVSTSTKFVLQHKEEELVREGLNTVIIGYREFVGDELTDLIAKTELAQRAIFNREDKLEKIFTMCEAGGQYLGMVGVEEEVLKSTVEAVEKLTQGGVHIWVTSGDDEVPTKIAAISAKILNPEINCTVIKCDKNSLSITVLRKQLSDIIRRLVLNETISLPMDNDEEEVGKSRGFLMENHTAKSYVRRTTLLQSSENTLKTIPYIPEEVRNYGLMVDGQTFNLALKDQECKRLLCCLMFLASTVLFCNMLPLQKAQVVKLIKENYRFRPVTLAIGDGNDDVAMIQEADIGVGIKRGGESRATHNADVSVAYFGQLRPLLLVQGRWDLQRFSKTAILFFYKNILLTMFLFGYMLLANYQPTQLFEPGLMTLYNIFFTSIPVVCLGLFDTDIDEEMLLHNPQMHRMRLTIFGWRWVALYSVIAVVQCVLIYMCIFTNFQKAINPQGYTEDFQLVGVIVFIALVLTVLMQISLEVSNVTIVYMGSLVVSMLILVIYLIATAYISISDLFYALPHIFQNPISVLRFLIPSFGAFAMGYCLRTYQKLFDPNPAEQLMATGCFQQATMHIRQNDYYQDLRKMYRASSNVVDIEEMDAFKIKKFSLKFQSAYAERSYRWTYIKTRLPGFRVYCFILLALLVVWLIYGLAISASISLTIIKCGIIIMLLGILYLTRWEVFQRRFVLIIVVALALLLIAKSAIEVLFHTVGGASNAIFAIIANTLLNVDFMLISGLNLINLLLFVITGSINYRYWQDRPGIDACLIMLTQVILLTGISVTAGILGYHLVCTDRKEFRLQQQTSAEMQRSRDILNCLLPDFVRARVRDGVRYIAEEKGVVSIVFCDIYDFDSICAQLKPTEITEFLDDLFLKFDELCTLNGVTKIETVGKTYMACAGLKDSESDISPSLREIAHARRAIEFAFSILRVVIGYSLPNGTEIKVKIGINSGPVVAGVVGYHKPQFSLVGDTVNTASRMCSTIENVNTIQISDAVHHLVEDKRGINFTEHFLSYVKGKGSMNTFFVTEELVDLGPAALEDGAEDQAEDVLIPSLSTLSMPSRYLKSANNMNKTEKAILDIQTKINSTASPGMIEPVTLFKCIWKETLLQRKFRLAYVSSNLTMMTWGLYIAAWVRLLVLALRIAELYYGTDVASKESVIAYGIMTGMTLVAALAVKKCYSARLFPYMMLAFYITNVIFILFDVIFNVYYDYNVMAVEVVYCLLQLAHCSGLFFREVVLGSLVLVIEFAIAAPWTQQVSYYVGILVFIIGFMLLNVYAQFAREHRIRLYTNMTKYAKQEIKKTEQLLSHMMPEHVLSKLKADSDTTDSLPDVTTLFADIVGFTNWSSDKMPIEVVEMLNDMFTRFDKLSVSNHVYKVHTIGDCYVVMGFAAPDTSQRSPGTECLNTVKMAFDMIDVINDVNKENESSLNMRIGLHTGTVIGGITGTNIVRYDIYGPDVMLANKMESNGQAGQVNVSDVTRALIEASAPNKFSFEFNKEVEVKAMHTTHKCYFIKEVGERIKAFSTNRPFLQVPARRDSFPAFWTFPNSLSDDQVETIEGDNIRDRHVPLPSVVTQLQCS